MPTNINWFQCNLGLLATGVVPCPVPFLKPNSAVFINPMWKYTVASDDFTPAYVVQQIQKGMFFPVYNAFNFTQDTPDATEEQSDTGDTAIVRNGKPVITFEYVHNPLEHTALYSYNSFRKFDVALIDGSGNWLLQSNEAGTELKGFGINYLNVPTYSFATGSTTGKSMVKFEIRDEDSFNRLKTVITAQQIGENVQNTTYGAWNVQFTDIVAAAGTSLTFTVTALNNSGFPIEGLVAGNLRVVKVSDNSVITISALAADSVTAGKYTATLGTAIAANDVIYIQTYDSTVPATIAKLEDSNQLIKGQSANITVTA